jgi:hypothetical protein
VELRLCREYPNSTYMINNLVEDQILNGIGEGIASRITLPSTDIVQGYLIILLSRDPTYTAFTKWKIALNNIILTREFKPHIDVQINEKLAHSLFIYDITKVINRDVNLKIGYEGKKPMKIDAATLITIHRYNEFHLGFNCIVKIMNLNNSSINIPKTPLSFESTEKNLNIGIVSDKNSVLDLEIIGSINKKTSYNLFQGFNIIETQLERDLEIDSINIKCSTGSPRHIFTCLFSLYSIYPRIDVKNINILEKDITLTIYNSGDSSADDIEMIFLRYGLQIYRSRIGSLKPGEEKLLTIPRNIIKADNVIARIVWHKALRTFSRDLDIKL